MSNGIGGGDGGMIVGSKGRGDGSASNDDHNGVGISMEVRYRLTRLGLWEPRN